MDSRHCAFHEFSFRLFKVHAVFFSVAVPFLLSSGDQQSPIDQTPLYVHVQCV